MANGKNELKYYKNKRNGSPRIGMVQSNRFSILGLIEFGFDTQPEWIISTNLFQEHKSIQMLDDFKVHKSEKKHYKNYNNRQNRIYYFYRHASFHELSLWGNSGCC